MTGSQACHILANPADATAGSWLDQKVLDALTTGVVLSGTGNTLYLGALGVPAWPDFWAAC